MDESHVRRMQLPRFTAHSDWDLTDMAVDSTRVALCGYNNKTRTTSIDLFTLDVSDSTPLKQHQRPIFSREFPPVGGSIWRYVSLIDGDSSHIVTVCGSQLDLYNIHSNDDHRTVTYRDGVARCVAVSETGDIYIDLYFSNKVIVFDGELNIIKSITLNGMERYGWPVDITVKKNNLFISTDDRALRYNMDGELLNQYNEPDQDSSDAFGITVSSKAGLVFVLWWRWGSRRPVVAVYSLADGHSLFSFDVDYHLPPRSRIRLSSKGNGLIVTTREGELIVYNTKGIFSFVNLRKHLKCILSDNDFEELRKYYNIEDGGQNSSERNERKDQLLEILKEELINPDCIEKVQDACKHLGKTVTSELKKQLEAYQSHSERYIERLSPNEGGAVQTLSLKSWKGCPRSYPDVGWRVADLTVSADDDVLVSVYNDLEKDVNVEVISRERLGNYVHSALVNFTPDITYGDRLISCINERRIVICQRRKLMVYNNTDSSEEQSLTLDGKPSFLTVRGSDILVVYSSSSCLCLQLDVFESNLRKKCGIKLNDVPPSEKIRDVAVISGKVIVCTSEEVFLWNEEEERKMLEYSPPKRWKTSPVGIDVNEDYQMVAILWSDTYDEDMMQISFHSINSRFCLFVADIEEEACKLRFINSDNSALIITPGGEEVSNISLHHISYFLSWNNFFNAYSGTILKLVDGCCHSHLQTVFNISEEEKKTAMSSIESGRPQSGSHTHRWQLWHLKCIFSVLERRTSSPSDLMALLIEAANELGKYRAYTLWSSIKFYQLCFGGSSWCGDIPYSSYARQKPAEALGQSLSSSSHPGTSRSKEQYLAAAPQSENSSVLQDARTIPSGLETQKRSATSESGSVEGSVSKRKYTLQEHSPTAVARTMVQMASMSSHQPQLLSGRSNLGFTLSQLFHNNETPNASGGTLPQSDTVGIEQSQQPLQLLPTVSPVSQHQRVNTNVSTSLHPQLTTTSNQGNVIHTDPPTRSRSEYLPSNRMTTSHLRGTSPEAMLHTPFVEVSSPNECVPQQSSLYHLSSNTGVRQQTSATISASSPSLHPAPMNEIDRGQLANTAQAPLSQGGPYLQLLYQNTPVTIQGLLSHSTDQMLYTNPLQPNAQPTTIHQSVGHLNSQSRQIIPLPSNYQRPSQAEGQLQVQQSETLVDQPDMQSGIRQLDTTTTPEMTQGGSLDVQPNSRRSGTEQTDAATVTEISQGNTLETNLESETEPSVGRSIPEMDRSSDLYVQTEQVLAASRNHQKEQGISTPHSNSLTVAGSAEQSTMPSTSSAGDILLQEISHHKQLAKKATTDATQKSLHKIASVLNEPFLTFLQNFLCEFRSDQRPAHTVQMSAGASTSGTHHMIPQQSCSTTREQDLISAASDQFKEYWSSLDPPLKQKLLDYKDKTDDREALVRLLVENMFSEEERRLQNCNGKAGLGRLDQNRLMKIRSITFRLCPLRTNRNSGDVEAKEWTRLCNVIDAANRHFREKLKRQSKH